MDGSLLLLSDKNRDLNFHLGTEHQENRKMKTLFNLLKPYKKALIIVAITDALGMLLALAMPYVMSEIVDSGIARSDQRVILTSAVIMLALAVLSLACNLVANKVNSRMTTGYTADVCNATFAKINSLTYTQYSSIGPSALLTRATDDIFHIEGAASGLVNTIVTVPIMLIGSFILAFMADVTLSLIFILCIPPVMAIVLIFMRPLEAMWSKSDYYIDEQNKIVRERLSGIRVVRAFNNEKKEHARAKFATEEMAKYMIKANVRGGYMEPIAMLLLNIATVIIVGVGGVRAEMGLMDNAGDIIAIVQYVALISGTLINLSWTISWIPRLRVAVNRINEIHSMPENDNGGERELSADEVSDIRLDNVSFTYPGASAAVLKNVSLEIKKGERIAVIGGTGSGKTTLVRLLLSLFGASEGTVSIAGIEYSDIKTSSLRNRFSVALQRAMIFEGSVRDNVKMGNPTATDEQITEALSDCAMDGFLNEHEEGLDYLLVGMGRNVSGGQRQRLNMARTVLREADIYVFDDSFSALDFLTESRIKQKLWHRLDGKTIITVTQRVSTAMSADRIYVMDRGSITDVGTHAELIKASSIYREICISQLGKASVTEGGVEVEG